MGALDLTTLTEGQAPGFLPNAEWHAVAYKDADSTQWATAWMLAYRHLDPTQASQTKNILRGYGLQWTEVENADTGHTDLEAQARFGAPTSDGLTAYYERLIALLTTLTDIPSLIVRAAVGGLGGPGA